MEREAYNDNYRMSVTGIPVNENYRTSVAGIPVSGNYADILNGLRRVDSPYHREYKGGPLNLHNSNESWVSPVEVIDPYGQQSFHVLYINGTPEHHDTTQADVLIFDEMQAKLGSNSKLQDTITGFFNRNTPGILIRPVQVGINVFPHMYTPEKFDISRLPDRISELAGRMNLEINQTIDYREPQYQPNLEFSPESGLTAINEKEYVTEKGKKVVVTDFILSDDPWKFYQIISGEKLSSFLNRDPSIPVPLRIDSGCDSGQIYHDRGCECRDQLHKAIDKSIDEGGLIIHIPTQDGRGYGMVTKMETEGIKRGFPMTFNRKNPIPVDTIKAAKLVFGESEEFDIRTFDGVARILKSLGVPKICLMTDNRTKISHMRRAGIEVCSILDAHIDTQDPELIPHLLAKSEDHVHYNGGVR